MGHCTVSNYGIIVYVRVFGSSEASPGLSVSYSQYCIVVVLYIQRDPMQNTDNPKASQPDLGDPKASSGGQSAPPGVLTASPSPSAGLPAEADMFSPERPSRRPIWGHLKQRGATPSGSESAQPSVSSSPGLVGTPGR